LSVWAAAIAAAAGIVVFFVWSNRQMAKAHACFTTKNVEAALADLLDPKAHDNDAWDLFLAWPIKDRYLESIRLECRRICRECPPVPGRDINEEGEKRVAALLADLRRHAERTGDAADALP
jgi:hypothetical protein